MRTTLIILSITSLPFGKAYGQTHEVTASFLKYYSPSNGRVININPYSNKGLSIGYERKASLPYSLQLICPINIVGWNHSILQTFPDTLQHSITSFGLTFAFAVGLPIIIDSLKITPAIGYMLRGMNYSQSRVFEDYEFIGSEEGYGTLGENTIRGFDHFRLELYHPRFKAFSFALESEGVLVFLFDRRDGDYYRPTDLRYDFRNLNFRLCYRIK